MTVSTATATAPRCSTPGCHDKADLDGGTFGLFCPTHTDILARIREDFQAEIHRRNPKVKNRNAGKPICCIVGCDNRRIPPNANCAMCSLELETAA